MVLFKKALLLSVLSLGLSYTAQADCDCKKDSEIAGVDVLEQIQFGKKGLEKALEALSRHYVQIRESHDRKADSIGKREEVAYYSSAKIWREYKPSQDDGSLKNTERRVTVLASSLTGDCCQVIWEGAYIGEGGEIQKKLFISTLKFKINPPQTLEDSFVNPLGFTVVEYSLSSPSIPEEISPSSISNPRTQVVEG